MTAISAHWMAKCKIDVPSSLMLSSPFAALEIAAVSPFLSASKTLNKRTLCSMLAPCVALEGVTGLASASLSLVFDMSMLSLLVLGDMVVERCGRWPIFDVRDAEGCRLEEDGSRTGRLVLLSEGFAMVSSATGDCGASPRLETRLRRVRVRERLWPPLLLGGGESVAGSEGCLCLCGLGERRDDMGTTSRWEGGGGACEASPKEG